VVDFSSTQLQKNAPSNNPFNIQHQPTTTLHRIDYHATTERVRARHPYWGYYMLQQALQGGADIIGRAITGECKVWLLKARKTNELRAVIINKIDGKNCAADIRLSADQMKRYNETAEGHYMWSSGGLNDRWRIYYSGAFFDQWGSMKQGRREVVPLKRYTNLDKAGKVVGGGFAVELTNGTAAALINIPLASAAVPAGRLLPALAPSAGAKVLASTAITAAAPKGGAAAAPKAAAAAKGSTNFLPAAPKAAPKTAAAAAPKTVFLPAASKPPAAVAPVKL